MSNHLRALCAVVLSSLASCSDDVSSAGGAGGGGEASTGGQGGDPSSTGGAGGASEGGGGQPSAGPTVLFPRTGLEPQELGVLVNDADPLSVSIAEYYVAARAIPAANVVHLTLPSSTANAMTQAEFEPLATQVEAALPAEVQALLITWTKPYAVDNMSVTSAFALGYRTIGDTCTDPNSQFMSANPYLTAPDSTSPFSDLGFRPAMTLPATTLEEAQAIIDRGIASDGTWPTGSAFLMNTSDQTRSARCILNPSFGWTNECQLLLDVWDSEKSGVEAGIVNADAITGETDVLFYIQGLASVADIATNTYRPGAVADHLTSYGGQIPTSGQMSAFQFLLGGATGSYGTVVEPCAYQQKFPDPSVLIPVYFGGATLIEAYWKSVDWPAEGIFLGEPLARPFGPGYRFELDAGKLTIETTAMIPGRSYVLESADTEAGPFTTVQSALAIPKYQRVVIEVEDATANVYRFREEL